MKDSGIAWVGEIPQDWKLCRVKDAFFRKNKKAYQNNPRILTLARNGVKIRDISTNEGQIAESYFEYNPVDIDDLLLNPMDLQSGDNCSISKVKGVISPAYFNLKNRADFCPDFYNYVFKTYYWSMALFSFGKGVSFDNRWTLNFDTLSRLFIVKPTFTEQKRIANYLNKECEKIDGLKADIQSQIDSLEQYKRSVITEAVTHGLNPSVPMKYSEISWVGNIPQDWQVKPLYCLYSERKNINTWGEENNLLSLSYGKVIRKDINTNEGLLPSNYNGYNIVECNDIIIRPTDLQNDKRSLRTGLVKERGIITSAYIALKPQMGINSEYYHYLLHSYDIKKVFYNMGNGVRQGLNYDEFAKVMVIVPSNSEQKAIAENLNIKCNEIDLIIVDKKTQLETLDDYKKSLIYECVTGKKEVPINEL